MTAFSHEYEIRVRNSQTNGTNCVPSELHTVVPDAIITEHMAEGYLTFPTEASPIINTLNR